MRRFWLLVLVACSHPSATPVGNTGGAAPTAAPTAGWTADLGAEGVAAAEQAIRGAADVAIVRLDQHGDRCMNSVVEAMTARLVEGVRGAAPATAGAVDRHTGFGSTEGYLLAALSPTPGRITVGDDCLGEPMRSVATPATIVAFVALPDLDSARAEAARLVVR